MPNVDREALQSLIWEADLGARHPDLTSDDDAAEIVDKVCRTLGLGRHQQSFLEWLLAALWIAGGTVGTGYANARWPVTHWYDWPLVWIASTFLVGVAAIPVIGVTVFAQDFWWERFGPGRRDAAFYGDPLTRRAGAASHRRIVGDERRS